LFNLRHAALRNIIERIFGVMKRQWRILICAPEYSMDIQSRIPAALCAIHNFMRRTNSDIFDLALEYGHDLAEDDGVGSGVQLEGPADAAERRRADARRDGIAQAMWTDYLAERARRGLPLP
jgi:hypothetical protein